VAERRVCLVAEPLVQGADQARLADSGLARQQNHLAFAFLGALPAIEQQPKFVLAPDQRRKAFAMERFEPTFGPTFALNPEGGERLGEAFQPLRPEVSQFEQAADHAPSRLADDYGAGLGERL
jgi:hypothetical protein